MYLNQGNLIIFIFFNDIFRGTESARIMIFSLRLLFKSLQFRGSHGFKNPVFLSDQLLQYDKYLEITSIQNDFPTWFLMNFKVSNDKRCTIR